jgi:hypothetical protein
MTVINGSQDMRARFILLLLLLLLLLYLVLQPSAGYGLLVHDVSWSHTTTCHSPWDSSGRVIIWSQRILTDKTQHTQQTNFHALGGIFFYCPILFVSCTVFNCPSVSYITACCGFFHYEKSDGFGRERTRDLGFQRPARKPLDHRRRNRTRDPPVCSAVP